MLSGLLSQDCFLGGNMKDEADALQLAAKAGPAAPLEALNLRLNPFGQPLGCERGGLTIPTIDVERLARWLERTRRVVELVGRPGRGKSSNLNAVATRVRGTITVVFERDEPILPARVVLVDEVDRLSWRSRQRLFRWVRRNSACLVIATHRSQAPWLRLAGLQVRSERLRGLSRPQLMRYIERRMEWARLGPGPVPEPPSQYIDQLEGRHRDDVRAIESALYDWVQARARGEV
jgi:hypothetical protein